jgi:hypothetical protein
MIVENEFGSIVAYDESAPGGWGLTLEQVGTVLVR